MWYWGYAYRIPYNADKCKLIVTTSRNVSATVSNEVIQSSTCVKLLGVTIDSKLTFIQHVTKFASKQVKNFMLWEQFQILLKEIN